MRTRHSTQRARAGAESASGKQTVYLLYHFFYPDDVISSRLYSDLGRHLVERGWPVVALPCIYGCHDSRNKMAKVELWDGVEIQRMWRLPCSQARQLGRLVNSAVMLFAWTWFACRLTLRGTPSRQDVVVVGTDPIFGVLITLGWRLLRPSARLIHWCHDMHPEASIADGSLNARAIHVRLLRWLMRRAYRRCDCLVDVGPCMRRLLVDAAGVKDSKCSCDMACAGCADMSPSMLSDPVNDSSVRPPRRKQSRHLHTVTPWSLLEPDGPLPVDRELGNELFGEASFGLLYSGNLGRAHDVARFLSLARCSARDAESAERIGFCFAGRGGGMDALRRQLTPADRNVRTTGFADENVLVQRLSACDVHLVSLKSSWTGTVVPSKFFGALAIGRPVLFAGSEESALAEWIREFEIGWVLNDSNVDEILNWLVQFSQSSERRAAMNRRCWEVYQRRFSSVQQLGKLEAIVAATGGARSCEERWPR